MPFELLIITYSYLAIGVGTFFEGEGVLICAGFLIRRGYLEAPWVILTGFLGAFVSDQLFFQIGRRAGFPFLETRLKWRSHGESIRKFLERHRILTVLGCRFFYGMRNVTALLIGISGFDVRLFLLLNAASVLLWTGIFVGVGYAFGSLPMAYLSHVKQHRWWAIVSVVMVGGIICLCHSMKRRRRETTRIGGSKDLRILSTL